MNTTLCPSCGLKMQPEEMPCKHCRSDLAANHSGYSELRAELNAERKASGRKTVLWLKFLLSILVTFALLLIGYTRFG